MTLTPEQARDRLRIIRGDLEVPDLMYATQIGPQGDMYRALDKLVSFLEDAIV